MDTTGPIQLKADAAADHPIFDGIELNDGITGDYAGIVTWNDTVQRGVSVNTNDCWRWRYSYRYRCYGG